MKQSSRKKRSEKTDRVFRSIKDRGERLFAPEKEAPAKVTIANFIYDRRTMISVFTADNKETLTNKEKVFRIFQPPKQTYKFQRKRKYNAPANHPWKQYKTPVNEAASK